MWFLYHSASKAVAILYSVTTVFLIDICAHYFSYLIGAWAAGVLG